MSIEKVVQYVFFETPLDTSEFIEKWEKFTSPVKNNIDVHLHRSEKNGGFNYLVQHHCSSSEFQFVFQKGRRSSKAKEVPFVVKQAGGYSLLQPGRVNKSRRDETKLFVFFTAMPADVTVYKHLPIPYELNIYEPYYENCSYACILEFFTRDKNVNALLETVKPLSTAEVWVCKESLLQLS